MIRIKVESVWNGQANGHGFRLTTPSGLREQLRGETWTRRLASEALDLFEHVYHFKRSAIRFDVR